MKKIGTLLFVATFLLVGCSDDDNGTMTTAPIVYTSGSADFSNYVSVGNSLTAGFSDNALFIDGQTNSFPNMLATQFALVGGGTFKLPLMNDNLGGMLFMGTQVRGNRLKLDLAAGPAPVPVSGTPTTEITTSIAAAGPYNNMGIPGAKSFHLGFPGYASLNPYYGRMATSAGATIIGDAVAQNPTFFSLWIGANDILSFATSGGAGVDQTGNFNPATYGGNDITDPTVFANTYDGLAQALSANGTVQGVVANLPSVTAAPYFTTVPYNAIPLDAATAAQLNAGFATYNGAVQSLVGLPSPPFPNLTQAEADRRMITFVEGQNAVLIMDEDLTDLTGVNAALVNMRQATADDLVVLTASSFLGTTVGGNPQLINGVSVPLADNWVLTPEEQTMIATATDAYNTTIQAAASTYNLAFVDAKALLDQISSTGITQDGITTTGVFATGGGFSLDGVHPSPRGYSLAGNAFIEAINTTYGSNLPMLNQGDYLPLYIN